MITGGQIQEARALLRPTLREFSRATSSPVRALDRIEATDGDLPVKRGQSIVVRHALSRAGIEFVSRPPGVRLSRPRSTFDCFDAFAPDLPAVGTVQP